MDILRNKVSDLEQAIYALDEPRGYAVAHADDDTYWFVELRGTSRVSDLTTEQLSLLQGDQPFRFAQLEHYLALRPGERTHGITQLVQPEGLVDDPVVNLLEDFSVNARLYNRNQPRHRIALRPGPLSRAVRAAHLRDTALGRTLSELLTIGNTRGHRLQHALRVAVHPGNRNLPAVVAFTQPVGDPADIQLKFARHSSIPVDANHLYTHLFGEPTSEIYADAARPAIAGLLGYEHDEIELTS